MNKVKVIYEKLKLDKEIQCRAMNKQNSDAILSEIKKFYGNAVYVKELGEISEFLNSKNLFKSEYNKLESINRIFLKKLENDFNYDKTVLEKIVAITNNKCGDLEYFVACKELFNIFYGFNDDTNTSFNFEKYEVKVKKALYASLPIQSDGWDKYLMQKVMFSINDLNAYLDFRKVPKDKRNMIFDQISKVKTLDGEISVNSAEFDNELNEEKKVEYIELKKLFKEVYGSSEDATIEQIFNMYSAIFDTSKNKLSLHKLTVNSIDDVNLFIADCTYKKPLQNINSSFQNIENYHYI